MRIARKIGYSMGDLGISISYFVVGFFFLYYLTDLVGMPPALAGTALLIGKLWDGINDPLIGVLSDRTRSRFGRKRVYILFGTIPFAASFVMLWMIPAALGQWQQFALATCSILLFSTTYSLVTVPYMALVPVMTSDYDERTQITGIRAILSTLGTITGGGLALFLSAYTNTTLGLRTTAISFAAVLTVCLFFAAHSVKGVEKGNGGADSAIVKVKLVQYLVLPKDKNVLILMVFRFLGAIATGCLIASVPYFAEHILGSTRSSSIGVAIYTAMSAALIPLWNRLTHVFDKRRLLLIANTLGAIVLVFVGLFMHEGYVLAFYAGCGLLGAVTSAYLLIPYSMVPDLVDYYRHKTGERHESVFFGMWMMAHQLGIAVAGFLLGVLLSIGGYSGTASVQPGSALMMVRLVFGLVPGLFLVITALVLQKYGITREVYREIRAEPEKKETTSLAQIPG